MNYGATHLDSSGLAFCFAVRYDGWKPSLGVNPDIH
jgi:hypothetical protein